MGNLLSSQDDGDDSWKSEARYAMEAGTYCVVCGGPFDLEGDVHNLDPKEPRYQWLYELRLLGYSKDLESHKVTTGYAEPRNISNIDHIFLSEIASFSMNDSGVFEVVDETGTEDIWYNTMGHGRLSAGSLFALHGACIETSCKAIEHLQSRLDSLGGDPSLAVLYRLLSTRWLRRRLRGNADCDAVNDLFELCHISQLYGPRSVLALTRLEWWGGEFDRFYADPIKIPDLEKFVFDVLVASSHTHTTGPDLSNTTREPRGIERLPTELFDAICSYLSAQSVIKLRRSSKTLAERVPLDNAFWRDRLRSGSLHPHIWDLDTKRIERLRSESNVTFSATGWDWRSVAKLLAMKQFPVTGRDDRLDDLPSGLWNRCRIWSIIEEALNHESSLAPTMERIDSLDEGGKGVTT